MKPSAKAANIIGLRLRTLQRWRQPETLKPDGRTQRQFTPPNKLTDEERENIPALANSEEFKNRTPHQIVPMLAECGDYTALGHECGNLNRRNQTFQVFKTWKV